MWSCITVTIHLHNSCGTNQIILCHTEKLIWQYQQQLRIRSPRKKTFIREDTWCWLWQKGLVRVLPEDETCFLERCFQGVDFTTSKLPSLLHICGVSAMFWKTFYRSFASFKVSDSHSHSGVMPFSNSSSSNLDKQTFCCISDFS